MQCKRKCLTRSRSTIFLSLFKYSKKKILCFSSKRWIQNIFLISSIIIADVYIFFIFFVWLPSLAYMCMYIIWGLRALNSDVSFLDYPSRRDVTFMSLSRLLIKELFLLLPSHRRSSNINLFVVETIFRLTGFEPNYKDWYLLEELTYHSTIFFNQHGIRTAIVLPSQFQWNVFVKQLPTTYFCTMIMTYLWSYGKQKYVQREQSTY